MREKNKNLKGFTLIEILIVIGLIAILAAITIIALNPTANFKSARDSRRRSEMAQIMTSINQWMVDPVYNGTIAGLVVTPCAGSAPDWTGTTQTVPSIAGSAFTAIFPAGVETLPKDPGNGGVDHYRICRSSDSSRITLIAPNVEDTRVYLTR